MIGAGAYNVLIRDLGDGTRADYRIVAIKDGP